MANDVALIGFGEAGEAFALAAGWKGHAAAFDIRADRRAAIEKVGLLAMNDAISTLVDTPLVLSLVTAQQALEAARDYARYLKPGALWCDMNSVAPETKQAAAEAVHTAGGNYIDVAVLAPVKPARMVVPLLVAGPNAVEARGRLSAAGFTNITIVGEEIGRASAIKMIRSVMVKGIEALTDEMMAAAEAAGVADEVLASLDASEKRIGWAERAAYNRERMATHGLRRAAEMEESARTLSALGVEPIMTNGTVFRQREAAQPEEAERGAA
ncbi:DUF1932 domain-containing protein [Stakelama sp. CBK3Z-3]|uniref:DUF1932 domain-containing protein n=1 Tax=Stakelama flava TaxID=2860338 RepID=A0ABS6XKR3_9SPHN|nr:NAD(P)-dependent oxidoreductase [Stakelama flava]MBW4330798.1 DUF1932 domain-containing protein [Stakelama flava]